MRTTTQPPAPPRGQAVPQAVALLAVATQLSTLPGAPRYPRRALWKAAYRAARSAPPYSGL